jgi:RNA polymerase sigma factor (sigma-70 family)
MAEIEQVYDRYRNLVWAVIHKMNVRPGEAEDLFMESWEAISRGLENFRGESGLATWIAVIARNLCLSHFRRKRELLLEDIRPYDDGSPRFPEAVDPLSGAAPIRAEAGRILDSVLAGLEEKSRFVLELSARGVRYRRIAQLVNRRWEGAEADEAWVARRIHKARSRLRGALRNRGINSLEDIWE